MLVFPAGFPPIYGTQLLYFKDPQFSERSQIPPPEVSDVVRRPAATPDLVFSLDD
jgi:type IV secretory pathway TraG/TraD family ATPase VirD4